VIPLFHEQIKSGGPVTVTAASMTRFLLSIDQAVDTIFAVISEGNAGEIYVPIVESATVENMAKALIGSRKIETKIIGIRPGEKMHEILVSEEECHHVIKRGNYYVILPMLPELRTKKEEGSNVLKSEFCSSDNVLDLDDTIELMVKHDLNVTAERLPETEELLR
jgi:UDP-glucose 4-epimerase